MNDPVTKQPKKLLILVPAFNEEGAVAGVVKEVRQVMPGVAVLVVDDCSEDGTAYVARSAGAAGSALNFALVTDLVRNRSDIGKVTSITVLGGNSFGMLGPIVTGYVVQLSGSFNGTFVVTGVLALIGATATLTMTRHPVEAQQQEPKRAAPLPA